MTRVNKISNQEYKKPILTPRTTGFLATGAIGLSTIRAFLKSKEIRKSHKWIGYLATAFTLLHIGTVEYLHHKYKKM